MKPTTEPDPDCTVGLAGTLETPPPLEEREAMGGAGESRDSQLTLAESERRRLRLSRDSTSWHDALPLLCGQVKV